MAGILKQVIVYSKVTCICLLFVAVAVIVFKNRDYRTNFWPGAAGEKVSTLWLMLATAVSAGGDNQRRPVIVGTRIRFCAVLQQ